MPSYPYQQGISTLVNHFEEGDNPEYAHLTPIYQTSSFRFPDVATGQAIEDGLQEGYIYTRLSNPNSDRLASKIAALEGLDLLRDRPGSPVEEVVAGKLFASGMAAITSAILARVQAGQGIIAQSALYGNTFNFLHDIAPRLGIEVVWVEEPSHRGWLQAFERRPDARLAYVETPVNPTLQVVDLEAVAEIAHAHRAWLLVDNTFASPYCQRPLSLGADVVLHSTTKFLSGHGAIVGGAVVSRHPQFIRENVQQMLVLLGATPSPFDAWLTNLGLKTFEVRMVRHCANALHIAHYLQDHPKVERVYYPGLESNPGYAIARRQMHCYGGLLSFELKGGLEAGAKLMDRVRVATLVVSLGNVDTLVQHPASMTHHGVPRPERLQMGISDGLVRMSVGIENVEDLIADLAQALEGV